MEDVISVSKGCSVYMPTNNTENSKDMYTQEKWYNSYLNIWTPLKSKLQKVNEEISSNVVERICDMVAGYKIDLEYERIPSIALFTGINLPDHDTLFTAITSNLQNTVNCRVSILNASTACSNVKPLIENIVNNFISQQKTVLCSTSGSDEDETVMAKRNCTLMDLYNWYNEINLSRNLKEKARFSNWLIIIVPDIEAFFSDVIKDLILAISSYSNRIPFIFIFGIATTSSAIYNILPYNVLSKLEINMIRSQPSVVFLNNMLEKIFLTAECPFQLGGKVLRLLTDVFLFYNFSIKGFIQGIQFCLMSHFSFWNLSCLCCDMDSVTDNLNKLREEELLEIMKLPSMKNKFRNKEKKNFTELKEMIKKELVELHFRIRRFHLALKVWNWLLNTLPHSSSSNRQIRELYVEAMENAIIKSNEFSSTFRLLRFLAKDEFINSLNMIIKLLSEHENDTEVTEMSNKLIFMRNDITAASFEKIIKSSRSDNDELKVTSRSEFRKKLMENAKKEEESHRSEYEIKRDEILDCLQKELLEVWLNRLDNDPLHELLIFNDVEVLEKYITPNTRTAINTALINPHHYLQCQCCTLNDVNEIVSTMPDVCIAYKLYEECGSLINLYDWLQSFAAVTEGDANDSEPNNIDPIVQARFTQAVSELQYLGFIIPSKKRIDHVAKLT